MPFAADEFTGRRFGKYEVLCRLAVGGMAEIFLGFPLAGPFAFKPVVLKRILSDHREDHSSLQMLIDEAKLTAQLSHRHVAQVLDLEVAGEDVILVIELIQGANLEELVENAAVRKELLPLGFVLAAIRDAAQGLQHAHSHKDARGAPMPIIHRDVTPRNVMVTFEGIGKVLDFGIARAVGASRRTVAGMVRGTAAYMSPEQAIDSKVDTRSDIFSLGTIFHELLVGQRLFSRGNPGKEMAAVYEGEIPTPSVAHKRVPKGLDAVVLRALERSVSRRYQTPQELIRDLNLAAGSAIWPPERCGQLVQQLFDTRQHDLELMLERIPDDQAHAVSTDVGRHALPDSEIDSEVRTVVGMPAAVSPTQTATQSVASSPPRPKASPVPRKSAPPPPKRSDTDSESVAAAAPTRFFMPEFGTGENTPDTLGDQRDVGTDEGPAPGTLITQPGVPANPPAERSARTRRTLPPDTATQPAARRGGRTALLVIGAVLAMVLGALGGVLVYRTMAVPKPQGSVGVGRLSMSTDRPAEVRIGETVITAPFADAYVPAGHHVLQVRDRGADGPWKQLEVDVVADQVTRLDVRLDALP